MSFEIDDPTAGAAALRTAKAGADGALITEAGPLALARHGPGIVRLTLGTGPDAGLLVQPAPAEGGSVEAIETGWRLQGDGLTLELAIDPLRLRLIVGDQTVLASLEGARFPALARDPQGWWLGFALDTGAPIHGLGEKFRPLDRRGQLVVSANHADPGVASDRSAKNVPFLWSPRGWGLFVHTRGRTIHGIGTSQWSHRAHLLRVEDARLDLFFIAAAGPAEILERFTALTGRIGPQPLWSLGAWIATPDAAEAAPSWRKAGMAADVIAGSGVDGFHSYGAEGDAVELSGADLAQPDALLARAREQAATRAVWSRAAWTGSQRFALPCGGDAEADWEGLAAAVRGALSWSLSGGGAHASEVMLPAENVTAAYELCLRWLQFAVLGSHLRLWDGPAAPWRVDPGAHAVAKEWLGLRTRLLPYIEGCVAEAQRSGMPVRRPMALAFPKDPAAHPFDTQFMLGPAPPCNTPARSTRPIDSTNSGCSACPHRRRCWPNRSRATKRRCSSEIGIAPSWAICRRSFECARSAMWWRPRRLRVGYSPGASACPGKHRVNRRRQRRGKSADVPASVRLRRSRRHRRWDSAPPGRAPRRTAQRAPRERAGPANNRVGWRREELHRFRRSGSPSATPSNPRSATGSAHRRT
ncbi:MAG: hypothetical protein EXQ92_05010 [Alphaproteobacteria bacterium]|nr:hypothetical protein [Alphaproteobacteria bacterium]